MKIKIKRIHEGSRQTLGNLILFNDLDTPFRIYTSLELPYKDNLRNISCIPKLAYKGKLIIRPNGQYGILLSGVPNRDLIEIHIGNYNHDIRGCIIIGMQFGDINHDSLLDVVHSTVAMNDLASYLVLGKEIDITIE